MVCERLGIRTYPARRAISDSRATAGPHSAVNLEAQWRFHQFSEIETGEQAISFASSYGLLGLPVSSAEPLSFTHVPATLEYFGSRSRRRRQGEPVADWLEEALSVRQAISLWERVQLLKDGKAARTKEEAVKMLVNGALLLFKVQGLKRGRPSFHLPRPLADAELDALNDSDDPFQDAGRTLRQAVTEKLGQLPIAPVLAESEGEGLGALAFRPVTLLAAIWMQLAQAISNIHDLWRCEYCGRLILIGWSSDPTSHGKRTNRRVCSDSCRTQWRGGDGSYGQHRRSNVRFP